MWKSHKYDEGRHNDLKNNAICETGIIEKLVIVSYVSRSATTVDMKPDIKPTSKPMVSCIFRYLMFTSQLGLQLIHLKNMGSTIFFHEVWKT